MEYVLIQRSGFREELLKNRAQLEKLGNEELVTSYNRQVEIGIVGVYSQAVFLAAMRFVFLKRFGMSPVEMEEGILLKLNKPVKLVKEGFVYID